MTYKATLKEERLVRPWVQVYNNFNLPMCPNCDFNSFKYIVTIQKETENSKLYTFSFTNNSIIFIISFLITYKNCSNNKPLQGL